MMTTRTATSTRTKTTSTRTTDTLRATSYSRDEWIKELILSHVIDVNQNPTLTNLSALADAVAAFCPECELVQGQSEYRTWKTDNGKLVGDYPLPNGWTAEDVGQHAVGVIRLTDEALKKRGIDTEQRNGHGKPYEIGIVPVTCQRDEEGKIISSKPGEGEEYMLVTDFWASGNGLLLAEGLSGPNRYGDKALGDLYMHYRMAEAKQAAEKVGDKLSFQKQQDGSWLGVSNTTARVGA
jgi:hypothetical protein